MPLSGDGNVNPHSWLNLRIALMALIVPGVILLAGVPVHLLKEVSAWLVKPTRLRFVLTLLLLAGVLRGLVVLSMPIHLTADWLDYHNIATETAATGEYRESGHLTTYRPPGWPLLLSLVYYIFGPHPLAGVILNALLGVVLTYTAYRFTRIAFGEMPARWTGAFVAVFPNYLFFTNYLCSEILFTAVLLLSLIVLFENRQSGRLRLWQFLLAGLVMGIAALIRPQAVLLILPVLLFLLFGRYRFARMAAFAIGCALVISPWVIRNYQLNGRATIATIGGMNLHIGNQEAGGIGFTAPDPELIIVPQSPADEARNDRVAYEAAWRFIREHPVLFLKRGVLKVAFMMSNSFQGLEKEVGRVSRGAPLPWVVPLALLTQSLYYLLLLFAGIGLFNAVRQHRDISPPMAFSMLVVVVWLAIHFVFYGEPRYHFPLIPFFAGFAGYGLSHIFLRQR